VNKLFSFNIPALRRMPSEIGTRGIRTIVCGVLFAALIFIALPSFAQYSANIQGTVLDQNGAALNGAHLRLTNASTGVEASAVSNATGGYRFLSLAPGQYQLETQATGFAKATVTLTLETNQTLDVPVNLSVASANITVAVTGEPPVLDTAETRNQMTLEQHTVDSMPLAARDLTTLITMAPGVTGLGLVTGGTPGSSNDNFSTEQQTDSSANGQGAMGNMFIVDGLDITSAIRPGVLNLQPNPDSVQEVSIQVNTYTVDYGRASSMQMVITTKGGGDKIHGSASDYFTNQSLWTANDFATKSQFGKYHGNNLSGTVGGPVWPLKQTFFFASIEPLRSVAASAGSGFAFEDPAVVAWAKTAYPNTVGTQILTSYPVKVTSSKPSLTMHDAGMDAYCGGANQLACDATAIDTGTWAASSPRNGTQWNVRLDKNFANDRLYGDIYKGNLTSGTPEARPAFSWVANTWTLAWQGNETHTFSANTINEASVAGMRVEGIQESGGEFKVPSINVSSLSGTGGNGAFGDGFAQGDFIQHNYHWRDVLTHIKGAHTFKLGYEGWTGDDVEEFQGPHDQPSFSFNNLGDMIATDTGNPTAVQPYSEGGVAYNPITGKHQEWDWNAASMTGGVFLEDSWRARRNITINFGIRWDDMGNPYSRSANTVFGNFYIGPGQSTTEQVANGFILQKNHALNRAITDILSPRGGIAWDVFGNSKWVLHGGAGVYHNWPTPANVQEEMRGNPPGGIYPNFYGSDTNLAHRPIFGLGTKEAAPFGFVYPTLSALTLNSQGGFTTLVVPINGINPNLQTPVTYIESVKVEHPLTRSFVASVGYSGAISHKLLSGGGNPGNVSYGVDINAMPNDPGVLAGTTPVRYNKSFGTIGYTDNVAHSTFNEFVADVHGRFAGTGFVDVSYTRSSSKDNSQVYPENTDPERYFGPSNWDAPNRISATFNYDVRGLNSGKGLVGRATGGWGLSGTVIGQSGYPFTVSSGHSYYVAGYISTPATPTTAAIPAVCGAGLTAYKAPCGDYNADGDNNDYPNVSSYTQLKGRKNFLTGIFPNAATQFTQPTVGTEGNEGENLFRGPGFFETNASLHKLTTIHEKIGAEFRVEIFNVFNHPNLNAPDSTVTDGASFGVSGSQHEQRWIQLGANIKF
jgi:hypothetical protein